jgi:phosphodiesterase/alkaline phosphatase D-like protein
MLFRNKLLLLTTVLTVAVAYAAAAPAPQAGQDIRITNGPVIEEATSNAAVIAWSTDVPSGSRVWYGTEKNNLTHSAEASDNGSKTHRVRINNLKPNTTYYFQVESSQRSGNRGEAESAGVRSFKTTAPGAQPVHNQNVQLVENDRAAGSVEGGKVKITNGPVIEEADSNHAQIAWSTNIKGSSRVTYGTDQGNLSQLAESPWGVTGLTHRVQLKNLKPGTTYFFQVETGQAEGSEVESHVFNFRTPNTGEAALRQHQPQQIR